MQLETSKFGTITVQPETVLTFPKGIIQLPGFEGCTRYSLFHNEEGAGVVHYLQSLDNPDVSFAVVDPSVVSVDYQIALSDEESALLKVEEGDVVDVLLMVYRPLVVKGDAVEQDGSIKAQTRAPLVLNTTKRLGFQKTGLRSRLVFTNVADEGAEG